LYRNLVGFIKEKQDFFKLSLVMCIASMSGGTTRSFLPIYFISQGFDTSEIGLLLSLSSIGGILSGIIFGKISDKIGRKPVIYVGLLLYAIPWILFWQAPSTLFFYLGMFLEGFSLQMFFTAIYSFISDTFQSKERGTAMGIYMSFMGLGLTIGPIILISGIYTSLGADVYFITSILFFIGTGLMVYLFVNEPNRVSLKSKTEMIGENSKKKRFFNLTLPQFTRSCYVYLIAAVIMSIGQTMIMSMFAIYLTTIGISVANVSVIYSVSSAMSIFLPIVFGKISDRYGRKPMIVIGRLIYCVSAVLFIVAHGFLEVLAVQLLSRITFTITSSVGMAYLTELLPKNDQGLGIGFYNSLLRVNSSGMGILGGIIVQNYGFNAMFSIASLTAIISALLVQFGVQYSRKIDTGPLKN
jgi:DHA1 family multidrug resistance protein-like MFS transporter